MIRANRGQLFLGMHATHVAEPAFEARLARAEYLDDVDIDAVGVSEARDGSGRQLILQRARSLSPQDRAHGHGGVCVKDASGAVAYGAVTTYTMTDAELALELTAEGAQALGLPPVARIGLELNDGDLAELKAGLLLVFGDAV